MLAYLVLAFSPVVQPVGPVYLILVKQVGQALCKLITFALAVVALQEVPERRKLWVSRCNRRQTSSGLSKGERGGRSPSTAR